MGSSEQRAGLGVGSSLGCVGKESGEADEDDGGAGRMGGGYGLVAQQVTNSRACPAGLKQNVNLPPVGLH